MNDDEDFTPRLGRTRGKDGKRTAKYLSRVIVATRLAVAKTGARGRRFDGSRIGRGASIGRLLSSRDGSRGLRARRAIIKTRLVRLGPKGIGTARAHLHYIQRDGVTRDGAPGELYSAEHDQADGMAFLDRGDGDRHQFRFIVSAEDGAEYRDLKPFIRRLMTQAETDLGTKLDWVAVDHFNTERPHTHIMLRGVDDRGENLVIAREYIAHGFRERAAELVTLDLGPRSDREIEDRLRHDVGQERMTVLDRRLLRRMDLERGVGVADRDPLQQSVLAGRLRTLEKMGLADEIGGGRYRLAEGFDETLRRMGERGDIIRTMQRELTRRRLGRNGAERAIMDEHASPVIGRIIHRGFGDEEQDRHYLLVDGVDGRVHYVDIGRSDAIGPTPEGSLVNVVPRRSGARDADRVIAEVAEQNDGRYSVDRHLRLDRSATEAFAQTHVRRLEAMRRANAGVDREPDGTWRIAVDHVERAAAFEQRQLRARPVEVETLSTLSLDRLARTDAATWLDRELASDKPTPLREAGFGRELRDAMAARRQWLIEGQLADGDRDNIRLRAGALAILQRRELLRVAAEQSNEIGKPFVETRPGAAIEGRLARKLELMSGKFALIEKSREFTLVPWRPALEKQLGKQVGGIMRTDGINWQFGRGRSGPEIG